MIAHLFPQFAEHLHHIIPLIATPYCHFYSTPPNLKIQKVKVRFSHSVDDMSKRYELCGKKNIFFLFGITSKALRNRKLLNRTKLERPSTEAARTNTFFRFLPPNNIPPPFLAYTIPTSLQYSTYIA